ncbi:MAG: ImmA/IrrE family metallo-endopeptidase [Beijerinckiaceae bacterium]|nr:ImmA/IrrE family metallo-endopeptidase [Beijerinckiaceae bacterium]
MTLLTQSERLLQELGVIEPKEIDLEAIAHYRGACVKFRPLDGCEARIIGLGDKAIITINDRSPYRRQRFSIAHELGHWHHHRGKHLVCRAEDFRPRDPTSPERIADMYAAELLMPNYLFRPIARQYSKLTFKTITTIAEAFQASNTATAIRLVEGDYFPALLVCHGLQGRKWFARAPCVPDKWFPREILDAESFAFGVLHGGKADDPMPRKIGAGAWFDRWEAERFEVQEQTMRTGDGEVLSLILISDMLMIEEKDDRRAWKAR